MTTIDMLEYLSHSTNDLSPEENARVNKIVARHGFELRHRTLTRSDNFFIRTLYASVKREE